MQATFDNRDKARSSHGEEDWDGRKQEVVGMEGKK